MRGVGHRGSPSYGEYCALVAEAVYISTERDRLCLQVVVGAEYRVSPSSSAFASADGALSRREGSGGVAD